MVNEIEINGMGKITFEKLIDKNKKTNGIPIRDSKYIRSVNYEELTMLIKNDYISSILPKRRKIRIFETMPINLISSYRYDVFIKYYYVRAYITNENYNYAKEIYLNHIKSFNNFKEPDGKKNSPSDFIREFNKLIDNMKDKGFYSTIIPITKEGEIIDGAHRLAIALYLKLKVSFAVFNLLDANYNRDFFLKRGFKQSYAKIIDKEVKKFK